MKAYIEVSTGNYPLFDQDIKQLFPNVSFAMPFVAPAGYEEVQSTDRAQGGPLQTVREGAPENVNGVWKQTWIVEEISDEEAAIRIERGWAQVRKVRDQKLAKSDWVASVTDLQMSDEKKQEWLDYRQALRDLTNVELPYLVQWPTEPRR